MRIRFIFIIFIFFNLLYFSQLFVIYMNQIIFENDMTTICYIFPIVTIISFIILLFTTKKYSESLYSYSYIIMGVYLGYLLYIFQIAIIIRIINIFI